MNIDCGDFIGHSIVYSGAYEPHSLSLATNLLAGGGVFVDVGCNIGLYTLTMGALTGVRCISIDGSTRALHYLFNNLEQNPRHQVVVVNSLVGAGNDVHELRLVDESNLGMMRVSSEHDIGPNPRMLSACTTLQSIFEKVNWQPITLLKLDVEGFELNVLRGLDWAGDYTPANIIMEYNKRLFPHVSQCSEFLAEKNYEMLSLAGEPFGDQTASFEENCWFRRRVNLCEF
jgi:FkbM family methyltransferase